MSSLLEAAAALAIGGAVLTLVSASLTGGVRVHRACFELEQQLYRARQMEHLVDRATLVAGAGPGLPAAVLGLEGDSITLAADTNGDGVVDPNSAEATAVEIRQDSAGTRVRLKLGRQTMTVLDAADHDAELLVFDRFGNAADAASAALFQLRLTSRSPAPPSANTWSFSVPAMRSP